MAGVERLFGVGVLHSPSNGFDDSQNDQTEAEIHSHSEVKATGHMTGGKRQVGHDKEINEVTHNDCR